MIKRIVIQSFIFSALFVLFAMPAISHAAPVSKKIPVKKAAVQKKPVVKKPVVKAPVYITQAQRVQTSTDFVSPLEARSVVVRDETTKKLLLETNAEEQWSVASITKLMTALVFLEHNPGWAKRIRLEQRDEVEGARLRVAVGTPITVREAFMVTLIGSANNTANAIARSTGVNRSAFVNLMNKKAKSLGMNNTIFVDTSGIEPGNVSTALDLEILARTALSNKMIQGALLTKEYRWYNRSLGKYHTIKNTNKLLTSSPFTVLGGKTGLLDESGGNIVMRVSDGKHPLTVVVLGAKNLPNTFPIVESVARWSWQAYQWVKVKKVASAQ